MHVCPLRVDDWNIRVYHSLRTFLARAAHDAIARDSYIEVEVSEDRSLHQNKSRDMDDS